MKEPVELHAFPSELSESVQSVLPLLVEGQLRPPSEGFNADVRGEFLKIPYRVYYRPERVRNLAQSAREGVIAACLGSRHYDGFLREECLARTLSAEAPWVVPFVVQLRGRIRPPNPAADRTSDADTAAGALRGIRIKKSRAVRDHRSTHRELLGRLSPRSVPEAV